MSPKRPLRRRGSRGFTLIEVMIALVVFAIGVMSLALIVPAGSKRITRSGRQTHASTLVAERAEQLLTTPFGDGDLTAGVHTDTANPVDRTYYVRWTVSDDTPIASCKKVTVQASRTSTFSTIEAAVTIVCPASGG